MKNCFILYIVVLITIVIGFSSCSEKLLPVIKMNNIPKEIVLGDSIVFKWSVFNAEKVVLKPSNNILDTSGTFTFKPKNDSVYTYKFTAFSGKNKASKFYTIRVNSPQIKGIVPLSVTDEEEFSVNWYSGYADYVMITGYNEKLPVKGERKIRIDSTEKIIFTAYNKFGKSVSKEYPVKVKYIEDFKFPKQICRGDSCVISWKYKKTKELTIEGFDGKFKPIDSVFVKPLLDTVYKIRAIRNNGDTILEEASIKVVYPRLLSFFGPGYIFKGEEATLKWTSVLTPFVTLEGVNNSLPPIGTYKVSPAQTTTYLLTTIINGEKQTLAATVNVITRKLVVNSMSVNNVPAKMRFDFEIFATDFTNYPDSVKLYVLVVDTIGNFITDLAPPFGTKETSKKYFKEIVETTSANKNHKVQSFNVREVHEKKDIPTDINITMDYSGSMYGTTNELEQSCNIFINKMPAQTRLSMVRFSDTIVTLCGLLKDKTELLKRAFFNPKTDNFYFGGTALYAAMDEGLISLNNSPNTKQMMIFTDGYECSSFAYIGKRAIFAQQVAIKARKMNVRINSLGYGVGTNEKVLKFLSVITGGTYYSILRPSDITNVMNECLYLNRNYYVITYKPERMDNDRNITLVYNSNNGKTVNANRDVFVGDKFDFQEFEYEGTNTYVNQKNKWGNLNAVSLPQVVARFDFSKSDLKPESYKKIKPFLDYLKNKPNSKIVISGHADHVGNETDCEELSKQRALSVKEYLKNNGITDSRIIIEPCGKKHPIWKKEDTKWKAAENRRVELLIIE